MLAVSNLEFEVPFQHSMLLGSRQTPQGATRSALILHGGGSSAAEGFEDLRTFLHAQRIETLAFDFVGHGRTGGQQLGTNLRERVQQVCAVIRSQSLEPSMLSLIGFSMGAYVAVKAAAEVGVQRLCLAIPAAYAAEAYQVPFGPEFSQILRAPRSWESSDAFDLLANFTGHLLVISAEEDAIVPAEITQRYADIGAGRRSTVHHVVKGAGHTLRAHYEREPQARVAAYTEIAALCQRGDA
jgi:uncharacterized protein